MSVEEFAGRFRKWMPSIAAVFTILLGVGFWGMLSGIVNEPRIGAERAMKENARMDAIETGIASHVRGDDMAKAALADSTASLARAVVVANAKLDAVLSLARQGRPAYAGRGSRSNGLPIPGIEGSYPHNKYGERTN